jgi:hypothetical protein
MLAWCRESKLQNVQRKKETSGTNLQTHKLYLFIYFFKTTPRETLIEMWGVENTLKQETLFFISVL